MEIKTSSSRMHSLIVLYDMHTDYFSKAIDGISDENAHNRLDTKANHISWIAGSLVHERFELAGTLGTEISQSAGELFKDHKGIQDGVTYPSLEEYKKDWEKISPVLRNVYCNISDEILDSTFEMPEMSMTYYELITFMTYREATCIGQIALWRRLLGLSAMKYM
ncbi:MAG TPA: DinB family protein [Ignavibacteria bacterium]|nr:DinB family protein [Ignavibacteria bacterium]